MSVLWGVSAFSLLPNYKTGRRHISRHRYFVCSVRTPAVCRTEHTAEPVVQSWSNFTLHSVKPFHSNQTGGLGRSGISVDAAACRRVLDMIWYDMIWYDMIWYDMIWYDMIWYDMIWYDMIWYDMVYLLTAIVLSPGGSTHLHTNNTQNNTNNNRTTQITTNMEECRPCPVFASFTLAFALQLRKKHWKTSVRVRKTSVRVQYTYYQNTHTPTHTHTHYKTI